jgi:hypothetical protein
MHDINMGNKTLSEKKKVRGGDTRVTEISLNTVMASLHTYKNMIKWCG